LRPHLCYQMQKPHIGKSTAEPNAPWDCAKPALFFSKTPPLSAGGAIWCESKSKP